MEQRLIGRSVEGHTIEAQVIGAGPAAALIFGGIHGDELESAELCRRFLRVARAPAGRSVWVIPAVNPDGIAQARKDNARGVDLNRNFPARSWQTEHPPGYHPGERPLSEPESAALAALIDAERPPVIVAVHQPFACVNWDGPAETLARAMSEASGLPPQPSIGYPTPGSFGSLYGLDRGLLVITLELPRPVEEGCFDGCARALDCATMWVARGA
jgi:protein MpaA